MTSRIWREPTCGLPLVVIDHDDGTREFNYCGQRVATCPSVLVRHRCRAPLARVYGANPPAADAREYVR
jgi:hypothetical protein